MVLISNTREGRSSWGTFISNRPKKNKNFLGIITGPTGSGKSWSALSICLMVDPTFTPERVVTSMKQMMDLINNNKIKSGQAVLWDEAGVDVSSRNWQSLTNKLINFLLQTFRHKRIILIFTVPFLDFIDAATRKLFHAEFITQKIDYKAKKVYLKPYIIQYNQRYRKFYYKYLRIKTDKGIAPLKTWKISQPPQWIIEEYERLKTEFTTRLNKEIGEKLETIDNPNKKPLTILQQQTKDLMEIHQDVDVVANLMNTTPRNIYFHINRIKNKGFEVESSMKKGKKEKTPTISKE